MTNLFLEGLKLGIERIAKDLTPKEQKDLNQHVRNRCRKIRQARDLEENQDVN